MGTRDAEERSLRKTQELGKFEAHYVNRNREAKVTSGCLEHKTEMQSLVGKSIQID